MKIIGRILLVSLLLIPAFGTAQEWTEEDLKDLVLQTIRENPEIVFEAVQILEERQARAQAASQELAVNANRDALQNDPNAPVLGNPDGDVTLVEFFDYNCPYCRRAKAELEELLAADPNVRVVFREWPILGDGSDFAARAALAAREQGKYREFHLALMALESRANEGSVLRVAQQVGLDLDQLREDMEKPEVAEHIATSMELARALGFNGTPSYVVGDALVGGFIEASEMQALVNDSREGG